MQFDPLNMTILKDRPLFFLHIPKTAGTSLTFLLEQFFTADEICNATYWSELPSPVELTLKNYRFFGGHFGYSLTNLIHPHPVCITFLRDPIERTISHYEQRQRENEMHNLPTYDNFENFLDDVEIQKEIRNYQTRFLATMVDPIKNDALIKDTTRIERGTEITLSIEDNDQYLFFRAKEIITQIDVVGLTEKFQQSLYLISQKLSWPAITRFETRNKTQSRLYVSQLSQEQFERISDLCKYDLQLYKFAKELFEEKISELELISDLKYHITENYRRVFETNFPPSSNLEYNLKHIFPGTGWHTAEIHPVHGIYRWSGPETTAYLDLPLSSEKDLTIIIKVIGSISSEVLQSLKLQVNDVYITAEARPGDDYSAYYEGVISKNILQKSGGSISRLTFTVDKTIAPSSMDANSFDTRLLGIALSSIILKC